jgi:hypothetical protein
MIIFCDLLLKKEADLSPNSTKSLLLMDVTDDKSNLKTNRNHDDMQSKLKVYRSLGLLLLAYSI